MKARYIVTLRRGPARRAAERGEESTVLALLRDIPTLEVLGGDELSGVEVLLEPEQVPLLRERVGETCHVEVYEDLDVPDLSGLPEFM